MTPSKSNERTLRHWRLWGTTTNGTLKNTSEWLATYPACLEQSVIRSCSWWWTIERKNENLLLQRNRKYKVVRECYEGFPRNTPVNEIKCGNCKGTMNDFIEFLHRKAELKTKYDFVLSSCKIFANGVLNEFVIKRTVKRTCYIFWTVTLQMKSYFKVM